MQILSKILIIVFSFSFMAWSAPVVIYDSGMGTNITPYLQRGGYVEPSLFAPNHAQLQELNKLASTFRRIDPLSLYFPLKSSLTPGRVIGRQIDTTGLIKPICILGDDPMSRNWLKRVSSVLIKNDAVCLITNVDSLAAYNEIKALSPQLSMQPAKGESLLKAFGLEHYPVVISNGYIEQ